MLIKIIGIAAVCVLLFGCSKPKEESPLPEVTPECIDRAAFRVKEARESHYGKMFSYELYQEMVEDNKRIIREECSK